MKIKEMKMQELTTSITPKTPIKYWGGKQQLAPRILELIPQHKCYCEPFFGGGAVFFLKPKSKVEVINDINDNMVNFYKIVKRDFHKLVDEIDTTLYSEFQWKQARELWRIGRVLVAILVARGHTATSGIVQKLGRI